LPSSLQFIFAKASKKSLQMYVTFLLDPFCVQREGTEYKTVSSKCFSLSLPANQKKRAKTDLNKQRIATKKKHK
jgi:hypothetical protein